MGQFSWKTQDTGGVIRESYGCDSESLTTAYMHDNKGNVWEEKRYEGYGVFGGKDYYELLAEMNGITVTDQQIDERFALGHDDTREEARTELLRCKGINLAFSEEPFISPNLTRHRDWNWENRHPMDDPNQGWVGTKV